MKKIFTLILTALISINCFAQVSVDPNDNFYKDAKVWEVKGIISWLPQLRPYSVKTVKKILAEVKEKGDEKDVELASYYEQKFFSKPITVSLEIGDAIKATSVAGSAGSGAGSGSGGSAVANGDKLVNVLQIHPYIAGDLSIFKLVDAGYKLGLIAYNKNRLEKDALPLYQYSSNNFYGDGVDAGPFDAYLDMVVNFTVGNETTYGMFGLNKIAFGPFIEDSVLYNGKQFHSGNFSFVHEGEKLGYTQVFSALARSTKNGLDSFSDFKPEKFMGFHTIRYAFNQKVAVSFFEASVFTNRVDLCYLIPAPYMVLQGMYGAADNAIMGMNFDFRPFKNLSVTGSFAFDDVNINALLKGEFDKRLKVGAMLGLNYTPEVSFIDNMTLDYTLVTPFTYSHNDPTIDFDKEYQDVYTFYNKDNFTNRDSHIGTRLPPNSDRVQFSVNFKPVDRLKLNLTTSFIRHANIAENFTENEINEYLTANKGGTVGGSGGVGGVTVPSDCFSTDGSIWTSPITDDTPKYNNFMNQEHKMYVFQGSVNAEYELQRFKWGVLSFNLFYMFEYIYNKGVDTNIYTSAYSNGADAKEAWVNRFYDCINNYFSFSLKYSF